MSSNHVTINGNLQADEGPDGQRLFQNEELPPEVRCILGIFSDCISKVETAAILPGILLLNSQSQLEDPELSRMLNEHQLLEQRLEMFEWHVKGVGEGEEEEEEEGEGGEVREEGEGESEVVGAREGEREAEREGEGKGEGEVGEGKGEGEGEGKDKEGSKGRRVGEEEGEGVGEGEEEESHEAMIRLEEEIKNSFRDLLRLLRARPETISAWKAEQGEELGLSERALIRELSVFQNQTVEKWLSSKHEEPQLPPAKETSSSDQDEEYMILMQCLAVEHKEVDSKVSATPR